MRSSRLSAVSCALKRSTTGAGSGAFGASTSTGAASGSALASSCWTGSGWAASWATGSALTGSAGAAITYYIWEVCGLKVAPLIFYFWTTPVV